MQDRRYSSFIMTSKNSFPDEKVGDYQDQVSLESRTSRKGDESSKEVEVCPTTKTEAISDPLDPMEWSMGFKDSMSAPGEYIGSSGRPEHRHHQIIICANGQGAGDHDGKGIIPDASRQSNLVVSGVC